MREIAGIGSLGGRRGEGIGGVAARREEEQWLGSFGEAEPAFRCGRGPCVPSAMRARKEAQVSWFTR